MAAASPAKPPTSTSAARTSGIILRFSGNPTVAAATARVDRLLGPQNVQSIHYLGLSGLFSVELTTTTPASVGDAIARLKTSSDIRYAESNGEISAPPAPAGLADQNAPPGNWGLRQVGAEAAWKLADGSGVVVAVLDSGVRTDQPDLAGRLLPGWNAIANNSNTNDDSGHGTYVAGIIAGEDGGGVDGVAPGVEILPVKILDSQDSGSTANLVAGINYAVAQGAQVINISADGFTNAQGLDDALANAEAHNVVVVAAAGNSGKEEYSYPAAAASTVLAVSASDINDRVATFSSSGPYIDLAAPGVDVRSAWWTKQTGDTYTTASGTSAAAPFVAGAAALVLSAHPGLSAIAVRQILEESAVDIGPAGIDAGSGHGRLDAALATRLAAPITSASPGAITLNGSGPSATLTLTGTGFQPNVALSLWVTSSTGATSVIRGVRSDSHGGIQASLGLLDSYPEGAISAYAVDALGDAVSASYTVSLAVGSIPAFAPIAPVANSASTSYFPQTGHSLRNGFKAFWQANGGLAVFGYPISEEFSETTAGGQQLTVQYFERYRFEYHPELAGTGQTVQLSRLGADLAPQVFPTAPTPAVLGGAQYFPQTGHTLSGPFLQCWKTNGGLPIFGYPISEPFEEGGHLVQYFERARLELHPDLPAQSQVLLTRFGVQQARDLGYLQ